MGHMRRKRFWRKNLGERDHLDELGLYRRIILKSIFRLIYIIVLVEKPGGKRPLRRPRSIWDDNIKMDLQAHRDHSHDFTMIKWKKLTTEELNGL